MRYTTSFLLSCICSACVAQEQQVQPAKHGMSFELLGTGGLGSVFYERFFSQKEKQFMTFRIGLGVAPKYLDISEGVNMGLPHGFTINFGRKHNFETGILGNLLYAPEEPQNIIYFLGPSIGYRRQTPKTFSRIFVGYHYIIGNDDSFFFNFGVAFGFRFRDR